MKIRFPSQVFGRSLPSRDRRRRPLLWSISEMRGGCPRPLTSSAKQCASCSSRKPTCARSYPGPSYARPWAAAPPPRRGPSVSGGQGSWTRGPTGFLPSLPSWLPPAGPGTAATSESSSLCALRSGRAALNSARATGGRTGSAGPRGWYGWGPSVRGNLVLVAPRLGPAPTIPFLRRLLFPGTPALFPGCLRRGSPGASNKLVSLKPRPCYHRVSLSSLGTLPSKAAPADFQ